MNLSAQDRKVMFRNRSYIFSGDDDLSDCHYTFWEPQCVWESPYVNMSRDEPIPTIYFPELGDCDEGTETIVGTFYQFLGFTDNFIDTKANLKIKAAEAYKNLGWIGVGTDYKCHASKLVLTGSTLSDWESEQANTPMNEFPRRIIQESNGRRDYRRIALIVALLELQRCDNFYSQPSGVDYAWAKCGETNRHIRYLCDDDDDWHYSIAVIDYHFMLQLFNKSETLIVGQEAWDILDNEDTVVIFAGSAKVTDLGFILWFLAHLKHPLAQVIEDFEMLQLDRDAEDTRREMFVRTAGLVDIHHEARKIIIVTSDNRQRSVVMQRHKLEVRHSNEQSRDLPADNADKIIKRMLKRVLTENESLIGLFYNYKYNCKYFPAGINWPDIDALSTALTMRFHQRLEGQYLPEYKNGNVTTNDHNSTYYSGAPLAVIKAYGFTPKCIDESMFRVDYGGKYAVTAMDCRVRERSIARSHPHLSLGVWSNLAELAVCLNITKYEAINPAKYTIYKCLSDQQYKLQQGWALRKATERIKKGMGMRDELAFPSHFFWETKWDQFVKDSKSPSEMTFERFASMFIADNVKWSWKCNVPDGNINGPHPGATLTGLRSILTWWGDNIECCSDKHFKSSPGQGSNFDPDANLWVCTNCTTSETEETNVIASLHTVTVYLRKYNIHCRLAKYCSPAGMSAWLVECRRSFAMSCDYSATYVPCTENFDYSREDHNEWGLCAIVDSANEEALGQMRSLSYKPITPVVVPSDQYIKKKQNKQKKTKKRRF